MATDAGETVRQVKYPLRLKGFTLIADIFFLIISVGAFLQKKPDHNPLGAWVSIGALWILFGSLSLVVFGQQIDFDDNGLRCRSGWRFPRTIPWSEITSFHYATEHRWWVIRTKSSGKVYFTPLQVGHQELIQELMKRSISMV